MNKFTCTALVGLVLALSGATTIGQADEAHGQPNLGERAFTYYECIDRGLYRCPSCYAGVSTYHLCDAPTPLCECVRTFTPTDVCWWVEQFCGFRWDCMDPNCIACVPTAGRDKKCLYPHCDPLTSTVGNPPCLTAWIPPPP